jgi:hypothetical protein
MHETPIRKFIDGEAPPLVVVLGTNEVASAIAVRLTYNSHRVILSHDPSAPVLRRNMAFQDVLFGDHAELDGIVGRRAESIMEFATTLAAPGVVAVTPLQLMDLIVVRRLEALVDARLLVSRVTPDLRGCAAVTIGVGPIFETGRNCDFAVDTQPCQTITPVEQRSKAPDDRVRARGANSADFVICAPREGEWVTPLDVGARVYRGITLGRLAGARVFAPRDGYLRGVARDGAFIPKGAKFLEIDPRGRGPISTGTDEHGRAVAIAVMQPIRCVEGPRGRHAPLTDALH